MQTRDPKVIGYLPPGTVSSFIGTEGSLLFQRTKSTPRGTRRTQVKKVYLAKSGDCYKIGISENPKERIKGISTACPEKVELIDCWDSEDAKKVERSIHGWLDDYNTNGEWFKLSENFAHFFCSIAAIAGVDETVAIITSFTNYQFDLISLLHRIVMEKIDGKK